MVSIANDLPGGIRNIKNLFNEARSRFAVDKDIDPKSAPKYVLEVFDDDKKIAENQFPSKRADENRFFDELEKLKGG